MLESVSPELYIRNAFRILGISSNASPRVIKKELGRIRLQEKLNQPQDSGGYLMELVSESTPDEGALLTGKTRIELAQEAVERLNDPQKRLIEEFFWFWPEDTKKRSKDDAILFSNSGDFAAAGEVWLERLEGDDERGIALHNLAVLNHMAALDLEHQLDEDGLDLEQQAYLENHWQKAYEHWHKLLNQEFFWKRLQKRVKELDDPRLSKNTSIEIKELLPTAIPMIAAKLAIQCVEKGKEERAAKHVRRIDLAEFPEADVNRAKALASEPIRERVNILVDSVYREAEEDPVHADKIVRRTLQSVRLAHDLVASDILFGKTHPTSLHLHDHVVNALNSCLVTFGNKTENWDEVVRLLEQVKSLARSNATKQKIKDALDKAKENSKEPFRWAISSYYDVPRILLNELERARELYARLDLDNAIGKLENAYSRWSNHSAYIAKPLSMCCFTRAMQRFAEVSREIENADRYLPSYKREKIRSSITQIGRDLARAVEMDPKNPTIRDRYRSIKEIGRNIGASIPRVLSERAASSPSSSRRSKKGAPPATRTGSRQRERHDTTSALLRNGLIVLIIMISALCLITGGLKSCAGPSSALITNKSSTRTPRIPKTPTRRPPTRTPSPITGPPSSCIRWDRVGQTHIGKSICVYGIVHNVKPGNGVFTIEFSGDWTDTKIQDFNHYWRDINPGECLAIYGTVRDNVSFLFVSPNRDNPKIIEYSSASACR